MANKHLYFAFGSNMSTGQMRRRCPTAARIDLAYVPGHDLVFNRLGTHRPGGVASIAPNADPESRVYGIVWRLHTRDLLRLDEIEDLTAYERITMQVHSLEGETYHCHTYRAFPQAEHIPPDPEYMEIILRAAIEAQFPQEYIRRISALKPEE